MAVDTEELDYMVRKILGAYPEDKRWPINIIDEVFAVIEKSKFIYYPQYKRMIVEKGEHKYAVNPIIGKLVKEHTHLETIREAVPAKLSNLIESYTELGPITDGNN